MQFDAVRNEAGINRFIMTPTKWIEQTNAIGIVSKSGRYGGGAYAHSDIAVFAITQFCEHFEIPYMTVSDWEHGNRRVPPCFFQTAWILCKNGADEEGGHWWQRSRLKKRYSRWI